MCIVLHVRVYFLVVVVIFVVIIAIEYVERYDSKMIFYITIGILNHAHSDPVFSACL